MGMMCYSKTNRLQLVKVAVFSFWRPMVMYVFEKGAPLLVPLFSINKYVKCILHPAISLWLLIHILHLHTSYHLHAFQMSKLVYQPNSIGTSMISPVLSYKTFWKRVQKKQKTEQKGPPSQKEMLFLGWQKNKNNNNKKIFTSKRGLWSHPSPPPPPPLTFGWAWKWR